MKMTEERWEELMRIYPVAQLTPEERMEGWHFCLEWDGLLVGPGMMELEPCHCLPEPLLTRLKSELPQPTPADMEILERVFGKPPP